MKKLWIYQSNRILSDVECARMEDLLTDFVQEWTAHGNELLGSFEIRHKLFVMLIVDESKAMVTGCSIDKSVRVLDTIQKELGINLFDRLQIAYRQAQDGTIALAPSAIFQELVDKGVLNENTIVFNNMLTSADDLLDKWEVPLKDSWHAKVYLPKIKN